MVSVNNCTNNSYVITFTAYNKMQLIFFLYIRNEKGRITEINSIFINMCKWDNDECRLVKGAGEHIRLSSAFLGGHSSVGPYTSTEL